MSAEVLYRKWRPRTFAELAGQEGVVRTLTNAIAAGKVAHAYLFSGPRGTGKTTTGRLLAKAVNCAKPKAGEACNKCDSCLAYLEGSALDLVELDAASNRGIDEIRSLREKANFAPAAGADAHKTYLVDEVHMLTEPAFNALLKTLEEPPPHVVFVLATTEVHKVPATVVSRCQRFDFRRIPLAAMVDRLAHVAEQEGVECPREALEVVARTATGSARDAINLLDQMIDSYGKVLSPEQVREGLGLVVDPRSAELSGHTVRRELAGGLALIASVRDDGLDLRQFQRQVVTHMRGLLLAKAGAPDKDAWSEEEIAEMDSLVTDVPPERIVAALRAFGEADLRADPLSALPLEMALATSVLQTSAPIAAPAPAPSQKTPAAGSAKTGEAPRPSHTAQAKKTRQPKARPTGEAGGDDLGKPEPKAHKESKPKAKVKPTQKATAKAPQANGPAAKEGAPEEKPATLSQDAGQEPDGPVAEARGRWPDIYQRVREIDYKTGALLNSGCGIIQASDDEIVFAFRHRMLLDRMLGDGGANLRALQQAVDDVMGAGRTARCVLDADVDVQHPTRGGHLVRAAEELGARVLPDDE